MAGVKVVRIEDAREDFPIMKDLIYMDSAATSLSPVPVISAMDEYELRYRSNVGRGVHRLAMVATQKYADAHNKIASFIGGKQGLAVITKNTTEAINMVAGGLDWHKGDRVVTTLLEHHSNYLPWLRLHETRGVELCVIPPGQDGTFDIGLFEEAVNDATKLIAVSHASNVLGSVTPMEEISAICRDHDCRLLVDGAQSVPHIPINAEESGFDYLCFSGHKMLGPTGTGVLWMKSPDLSPLLVDNYMEAAGYQRYEAGTPPVGSCIGLGKAVDYLEEIGMENIRAHEKFLTTRMIEGLSSIKGVTVYGPPPGENRIGVVSFTVENLHPHDVAHILDEAAGIMVRSGEHCCIPLMRHIGTPEGTVRASLHLYNNADDVERLIETVEEISRMV
ncbi:MAG: cysteine desulfurase [Methanoregulaceae archaeon]|nr:cysteine desulfurase [Methanoregulaceae archaeon]